MRVLVAIPCYNCEIQIGRVLNKLLSLSLPEVDFLIVENHSQDKTREVIRTIVSAYPTELKERFNVIFHKQNYGLGGSFKTIYSFAAEHAYDYIVLFHGDDQATTNDLKNMINEVMTNRPDCLLGARFMPGSRLHDYSRIREYGNKMINFIFTLALGRKIYDIGSGLNAYKVKSLPHSEVTLYPDHIAFDINLLFNFMDTPSMSSHFFPIEWHEKDQRSNASNIRVGIDVMWMLIKHKLGKKNLVNQISVRDYEVITP